MPTSQASFFESKLVSIFMNAFNTWIAEPEDIADVILFLASDASRYIVGTVVEVNGGKPVK